MTLTPNTYSFIQLTNTTHINKHLQKRMQLQTAFLPFQAKRLSMYITISSKTKTFVPQITTFHLLPPQDPPNNTTGQASADKFRFSSLINTAKSARAWPAVRQDKVVAFLYATSILPYGIDSPQYRCCPSKLFQPQSHILHSNQTTSYDQVITLPMLIT